MYKSDQKGGKMKKFIEDSYCGLFCGACEIMLAYKKAKKAKTEAKWDELPKEFTDFIPKAEVKCYGCKTDDVFIGCKGCGIRDCAREKGVEFCFECNEYPCRLTNEMKKAVRKYKKIMPHATAIIGNLEDIRSKGKKVWLSEQKKLWSCPDCGERFGWYHKACSKCGRNIKG